MMSKGKILCPFIVMYFDLLKRLLQCHSTYYMNELIYTMVLKVCRSTTMLLDSIVVCVKVHESASATFVLLLHHLLELNSHSHCSLQSISHLHLPFAGSKQRSMWLMRPAQQIRRPPVSRDNLSDMNVWDSRTLCETYLRY